MNEKEKIRRAITLNLRWAAIYRDMMKYHIRAGLHEEAGEYRLRYKDHVRLARRLGQQLRSM